MNKTKRLAPISWSVGALFFSRTADHAPSSARPLSLRDVWSTNFFFFWLTSQSLKLPANSWILIFFSISFFSFYFFIDSTTKPKPQELIMTNQEQYQQPCLPPPSGLNNSTLKVLLSSGMLSSIIVMLIVLLREPAANSTAPVLPVKSSGDLAVPAVVFHWHLTLPGRNTFKEWIITWSIASFSDKKVLTLGIHMKNAP